MKCFFSQYEAVISNLSHARQHFPFDFIIFSIFLVFLVFYDFLFGFGRFYDFFSFLGFFFLFGHSKEHSCHARPHSSDVQAEEIDVLRFIFLGFIFRYGI